MRQAFVVLCGLLLLTLVYQFVTAGLIIFEGNEDGPHGGGAAAAHLWPLLMVIVAAVGKLGKRLIITSVVLLVLVTVQSGLPDSGAAWLHPLVALLIGFGAYHAFVGARAGADRPAAPRAPETPATPTI